MDYGMVAVRIPERSSACPFTEDGMLVQVDKTTDLLVDNAKEFEDTDGHQRAEDAIDYASAHEFLRRYD